MTYTREVITYPKRNATNSTQTQRFLWQNYLHAGTGLAPATRYVPVMQPNDVACDCKSQAAAVRARRNERLEDLVADGAGDADAVIQHLNRCLGRIWRQHPNDRQAGGHVRKVKRGDAVDDEIAQGGLE